MRERSLTLISYVLRFTFYALRIFALPHDLALDQRHVGSDGVEIGWIDLERVVREDRQVGELAGHQRALLVRCAGGIRRPHGEAPQRIGDVEALFGVPA